MLENHKTHIQLYRELQKKEGEGNKPVCLFTEKMKKNKSSEMEYIKHHSC